MAEKYVKEILEKLEEIEKLHAKLRSIVIRMKNHETRSSADVGRRSSKPKKKKESVTSNEKEKNSWKQKLSDIRIDASKLQNPRGSKYLKKLKSSSSNFVTEQWRDKKGKVKNFLTGLTDRDVVYVTRASQTIDGEMLEAMLNAQQKGNETVEFPWKEMRYKRNQSLEEPLERLPDRSSHPRVSDPLLEGRVAIRDHSLTDNDPHRVLRETLLLPEEETSRILSNARAVSVIDTETDSSLTNRVRRFVKKFSSDSS